MRYLTRIFVAATVGVLTIAVLQARGSTAAQQTQTTDEKGESTAEEAAAGAAEAVDAAEEALSAAGGALVASEAAGLELESGPSETIRVVGSDDLVRSDIDHKELIVELLGSGDVVLQGECENLTIRIVGSGEVDARRLEATKADVQTLGPDSGDAHVSVSSELKIAILGSGDIYYYGEPESLEKAVMGSGSVMQREKEE